MKAFLMHREHDFDAAQQPPPLADDLVQDLELRTLFTAMAADDPFLLQIAKTAVLCSLRDIEAIRYRQEILRDCLANAAVVRGIYDLAVEAIEGLRNHYWGLLSTYPGSVLHGSVDVLRMFVGMLRRLRYTAETEAARFASEGFRTLFAMLRRELAEDYLGAVESHIERLKFRRGPLISARLGKAISGTDYVLRRPHPDDRPWVQRLVKRRPAYSFRIADRDEAGARAVGELRDRGIGIVANAVAQSDEHILSFFRMLRTELAFYVGCLNLQQKLAAKGAVTCIPAPTPCGQRRHSARGLYDPCLALAGNRAAIGNDFDADGKDLFLVTGANQGGKSTWLRAIGVSQLMLQAGMFVPARAYSANLGSGLFVHFRREEDAEMRAGKFEEELQRISAIVDQLSADGIVLFNEALQSTNEREGSEIGRQIVQALVDSRIKVFIVTHMYDLARSLRGARIGNPLFLRAERLEDGTRTFRIIPGAPLPTSHAKDVYEQVFHSGAEVPRAAEERAKAEIPQTVGNEIARVR
jgi:DNA mismatch repair ATPase MutS